MEHPQDQTRGEPLFLINYINIFNSRGQFPSYLIIKQPSSYTFGKNFGKFCEIKITVVYPSIIWKNVGRLRGIDNVEYDTKNNF